MTDPTIIVGVDPSLTATAIHSSDGTVLVKSKLKGMARLAAIAGNLLDVVDHLTDGNGNYGNIVVYIEGYSYNSGNQAHQVGELGGVLRHAMWLNDVNYVDIAPKTLKKFITGKGNAGKDLMVSSVSARTGVVYESNDVVDAFGLWCLGMELAGESHPLTPLPKVNLSALDNLRETS